MEQSIVIRSVNTSSQKGTVKIPVSSATIDMLGICGDAHAGEGTRQISLLGVESYKKQEQQTGKTLSVGSFGENLTTEGMELHHTKPLDVFYNDSIKLEITQIGKTCHGSKCAIYNEAGNCIMPKEGIFCRVITSGSIASGDTLLYKKKVVKLAIITVSDRASKGIYEDRSGPILKKMAEDFFKVHYPLSIETCIIPDEENIIKETALHFINDGFDFIFTTGGTGIGPRDITPDVIALIIEKDMSDIMTFIRLKYGQQNKNALLSRSIACVKDKTQLFVLPGSVRAVEEYFLELKDMLLHNLYMLHSIDKH